MAIIITLSGQAEAGKDSVALIIKEKLNKKTLILHYADYLKFIAKQYFEWNGAKDEAGRTLLQHLGTDIIRTKEPNFWVDTLMRFIYLFEHDYDYFIIPDVRFKNEIEIFKEQGFGIKTIHVSRLNHNNSLDNSQKQHVSERDLDNYKFDIFLQSESCVENLKREVDKIFNLIVGDKG